MGAKDIGDNIYICEEIENGARMGRFTERMCEGHENRPDERDNVTAETR